MRELAFVASVALLFGLAALRLQGEVGGFVALNLGLAALALVAAIARAARGARVHAGRASIAVVRRAALLLLATLAGAIALERAAMLGGWRADWTLERTYELAPATTAALEELDDLQITLYHDAFDPRVRRTRLLLEQLAAVGGAQLRVFALADHPEDEDRFGIGSSNSVVLTAESRWELVERPTEGALFEALSRLRRTSPLTVYATVGTGEGSVLDSSQLGYSGLAAALETEGYRVEAFPLPLATEIPPAVDVLLVVAPARALPDSALDAVRGYLVRGGRLIVMLEPGRESGIEGVLAEYGLRSPQALLIDPASVAVDGEPPGTAPLAYNYADHPVAHGLDSNRFTFFRGARSFFLRKVEREDRLRGVVTASSDSWLSEDLSPLSGAAPPLEPQSRTDYHPLVVAGSFRRGPVETRIVAFGDSDFASNRYLRALYNLDLAMNAVHWVSERESEVTLRPKGGGLVQFPVPIQSSLQALYGVGLVVPELLLLAGGIAWLRRRGA